MTTGKLLMQGWQANSITAIEYFELAKKLNADGKDGKAIASRKHTPIEDYIQQAYRKYCEMCYYLNHQPLKLGAWLRSTTA